MAKMGQGSLCSPPSLAELAGASLLLTCHLFAACSPFLTLICSRKGALPLSSMPWRPPWCGSCTPLLTCTPQGLRPMEPELDTLPARQSFYLISLLQSWQYLNINACL